LIAFALSGYPVWAFFIFLPVVVVSLVLVIRLALWGITKTGQKNTIMLEDDQTGFVASSFDKELIGKEGVADTDLKPSGKILLEDKEYQAVSEMGYINKGTPVKVLRGEGAHLIVKEKN
jgi:membrane-bound serine protease (ClpP class)